MLRVSSGILKLDYQGLLTLLPACTGSSLSQTELSSEDVEEESKHQGSKVSNARPFTHKSLVTTHQDVTCAFFSPTMQVPSEPAEGESDPHEEAEPAAVKGECKVNSGGQRWAKSTVLPPSQVLRLLWLISAGSLSPSSHSRLDQKEGSCLWSPQLVPWEGGKEGPSS